MRRRVLLASLMAGCLAAVGALVGVVAAQSAYAATTQQTFLTFYGWWDNTPPGAGISFPKIHKTAGGKGTFADPITFATATAELSPGTKVWVPRVKKYFIMEDSCEECTADWLGHGPDGGPKLHHIDLWIGGKGGSPFDAIDCEDALTNSNPDGTPALEPVLANPPSNEPVDSTPLFNTKTGACGRRVAPPWPAAAPAAQASGRSPRGRELGPERAGEPGVGVGLTSGTGSVALSTSGAPSGVTAAAARRCCRRARRPRGNGRGAARSGLTSAGEEGRPGDRAPRSERTGRVELPEGLDS